MAESELCWECRDWMKNSHLLKDPYLHCHHDPKEKPKCWCERHSHFLGDYTLHENEKLILIFCPQCGKKLSGD